MSESKCSRTQQRNASAKELANKLPTNNVARAVVRNPESLGVEHALMLKKFNRRLPPVTKNFKRQMAISQSATVDLRRALLSLAGAVPESSVGDCGDERNFLRYQYFIREGVDIVNVAPIDESWILSILSLLPSALVLRYRPTVDTLLQQVREEFSFSVKKSAVDFALHGPGRSSADQHIDAVSLQNSRHAEARKRLFGRMRSRIERNLYKIHPTIAKINQLWYIRYSGLRIANVNQLYSVEALDLNSLIEWFGSQIQSCENVIFHKWIPTVFKMVSQADADKRNSNDSKGKNAAQFYQSLSTLMTLQLQNLCSATILEYTDFVCDVDRNPGFQTHVLYKNNKIIFGPSYDEFCKALSNVYASLLSAVSRVPRIETKLMARPDPGHRHRPTFLKPSILAETVERCRRRILATLQNEWICPELRIQDFDEYICLINGRSRIEVNKFLSEEPHLEAVKRKVSYYRDLGDEILLSCHRVVTIGLFEIHREHFVAILANKARATRDRFLEKISDTYQEACKCLTEEFQSIKDALLRQPADTNQLVRTKEYSLNLGTKVLFEMEQRLRDTIGNILFCSDFVALTSAQIKRNSFTFLCYRRINAVLEHNQNIIAEKTKAFQELLLNRVEAFERDLEKYERETDELQSYREAADLSKYLKKAQNLSKKFAAAQERIRQFNQEEVAFGWMKTQYPQKERLVEKLKPYKMLYENCANYKNKYRVWTESKIGAFEPQQIQTDVETFHRNIVELSQQFSAIPAPYALTNSIRSEVEQFQKHMPIVRTLGNPCLKDRHWEKISEIVGFPMRATDDLTLAKILDYGLEEYVPKFEAIGDSATKESDLETRLKDMMAEWKDVKFDISTRSGAFVLASTVDIQTLLDDHIVKTQGMKNSPYIEPFEKAIGAWEEKLIFLQEIIDVWLSVQKSWLYLEPVFTAGDIQQLVPDELKRFSAVDKVWRDAMKQANAAPSVMAVASIDKILEKLAKCDHTLDTIRTGLSAFLRAKRVAFSRFFFLSDREILDIVSSTRRPTGIEPFLAKCFGCVEKLRYTDDLDVVGMISKEGEELRLCEEVDTGAHRGAVEKWLAQLERVARLSVKREIKSAIDELKEDCLVEWSAPWTQQAIALANALVTGSEIETNLADTNALSAILKECQDKLAQVTSASTSQGLFKTKLARASAAIYWSHTKDILQNLIKQVDPKERSAAFTMEFGYSVQDEDICSRMVDCKISYGYEYVGGHWPAVWTPLTQRCYRSFFLAFKYNYGACLQGPTGCGKTEIIENFARLCGRHSKTLNCVAGLDERTIRRFFKGVMASDSWMCFDNADAAGPNASAAVDYFFAEWQRAVLLGGDCAKSSVDGRRSPAAGRLIFVTAAPPYYAERRPLALFTRNVVRRVCFERCHYEQMVRARLAVLGFERATDLADRLNVVLRLCAALFARHERFRTDNRAVKRLLDVVEKLKGQNAGWPDEKVVRSGVDAVYGCTLTAPEAPVLQRVLDRWLADTSAMDCQGVAADLQAEAVRRAVRQSASAAHLVVDDRLLENVARVLGVVERADQGVVVCGAEFAGKSRLIGLAAETLKRLKADWEVNVIVVNPKSISTEELYGRRDESTNQWLDGVLTALCRLASERDDHRCERWLVMDGPLDPTWTENLNSALDEAPRLHLPTGESVSLGRHTRLIFETADLKHVSPTTASRCFVVHLEDGRLEWRYLVGRWLRRRFPDSIAAHRDYVEEMALRFCRPLLRFVDGVRRAARLIYAATDNQLVRSMLRIFASFVDQFRDASNLDETPEIDVRSQLEGAFFFSCVWSLGALLGTDDRCHFDVIFRALLERTVPEDVKIKYDLPDQLCAPTSKAVVYAVPDLGTVFDYRYVMEGKGKWKLWTEAEATFAIPRDVRFDEIVVPTAATVRNRYLISLLVQRGQPMALVGDAASGKTTAITNFLETTLDRKELEPVSLNFSANTSSDSIRRLIGHKLRKRKKGEYGPPLGIRYVIFIDDLNAASTDRFGTNSAIELLRHCVEHRRWYARYDCSSTRLIDLQYMCAFTTRWRWGRENGRSCARFLRHFNVIGNDVFDDRTLKYIYEKIMLWHLDTRGFGKEFDPCIQQIVEATLAIRRLVESHLLPVPSKAHYLFSFRDFARVIRGVVTSVPEAVEDLPAMKRLWLHEVLRVYHDRIVDAPDSNWFCSALKDTCDTRLNEDLNVLVRHLLAENETEINRHRLKKLIFCDFLDPKADVRNYAEVRDLDGLQSIVEGFLIEYNNVNKKPMNLLLFSYAIEHISRVCRILKQPRGHALLLGEYGCGKQSLARLAIHICEFEYLEIAFAGDYRESDWREDAKRLLFGAFTDQQSAMLLANLRVLPDFVLEDVNSLLRTARIPALFTAQDEKEICDKMEAIDNQRDKSARTDGSREALLDMFFARVRKQMHLVLVFHSSVDEFRRYAREYPALVDYCAMDVFETWPAETRSVVARKLLGNIACGYDDIGAIVELCEQLYSRAKALAVDPNVDVRFTQKSFIRLVATFDDIFSKKFELLSNEKGTLDKAINRLAKLDQDIPSLEERSKKLAPLLLEQLDSLRQLETQIEAFRESETRAEIATNEAGTATSKMEKVRSTKMKEYEERLDRMKREREGVVENLRTLTTNDTAILKAMKSPPKPVKLVADAIAYVLELKAEKTRESGKMAEDFWKPAIKVMCDSKLADTLNAVDPNDVPVRTLRLLEEKIFHHEDADAAKIRNYSVAAEAIFRWVRVLYDYGQLVKADSDARLRLDQASEQLADAKLKLEREEKNLKEIRNKRRDLTGQLKTSKSRQEELRREEADCTEKRQRAEQLVRALRGKRGCWMDARSSCTDQERTLIGDSLLCAATVTFLTSLPEQVRAARTEEWRSSIEARRRVNGEFSLARMLCDEQQRTHLETEKLSDEFDDPFFYDNAAIVRNSSRYVLVDDAEGATTDWLTRARQPNGSITIRCDRPDWARNLENAVSSGSSVILEHEDGELDPALYPLLEKQTFRTATGSAVRMGRNVVEFDSNFRLYVRTKMEAPRHSVEIYEKLTVVNCAATESGVKNAVAKLLLRNENADAVAEINASIAQLANARQMLNEADSRILTALARQSEILDDETATNGVVTSAQLRDDCRKKTEEARGRLEAMAGVRREYALVAEYICSLFRVVARLRALDAAYHFSLKWLRNLVTTAVESARNVENAENRGAALSRIFFDEFYAATCRSLLPTDKLVFEFLLATRTIDRKERGRRQLRSLLRRLRQHVRVHVDVDVDGEERSNDDRAENMRHQSPIEAADDDEVEEEMLEMEDEDEDEDECDAAFRRMLADIVGSGENVVRSVGRFVTETLKPADTATVARHLDSICRSTSRCTPIAVTPAAADANPLYDLLALAVEKGMSIDKCVILAPFERSDSSVRCALDTAKCVGSWLIVPSVRWDAHFVLELETALDTLTRQTVHPDFRLWLILDEASDATTPFSHSNCVTVAYAPSRDETFSAYKNELSVRGCPLGRCQLTPAAQQSIYENVRLFENGLRDSQLVFEWSEGCEIGEAETRIAFHQICEWTSHYRSAPVGQLVLFLRDCCYGTKLAAEWDAECLAAILASFWNEERIAAPWHEHEAAVQPSPQNWVVSEEIYDLKMRKETSTFVKRLFRSVRRMEKRATPRDTRMLLDAVVRLKESLPPPFERLSPAQEGDEYESNVFTTHVLIEEVRCFETAVQLIGSRLSHLADCLSGRAYLDDDSENLSNRIEKGTIPMLCWSEEEAPCERIFHTARAMRTLEAKYNFLQVLLRAKTEKSARPVERICDPRLVQFPRSLMIAYALQSDTDLRLAMESGHCDTFMVLDESDSDSHCADASHPFIVRLTGVPLQNAYYAQNGDGLPASPLRLRPRPPHSQILWSVAVTHAGDLAWDGERTYACPVLKVRRYSRADRHSFAFQLLLPSQRPSDHCLRARICILDADSF